MSSIKEAAVYVKFPRTGLGNMLLTWSRGFLFARLNGLEMISSGWGSIHWGAWLRWERKKRMYGGSFREDTWWSKRRMERRVRSAKVVKEPVVEKVPVLAPEDTVFVFDEVSPGQDLFGPMRPYRTEIGQAILKQLTPRLRAQLDSYDKPVISVHIRRGDFKKGNPITPLSFFIEAVMLARSAAGRELPVTIFTDAAPDEIKEVMALPSVSMATEKPDILDILLMSRSRMIVLSQSSTFSYWAAFLSEAIVVRPAGDWQGMLRPAEVNRRVYEGKIDMADAAAVETLRKALAAHNW